MEIYIGDGEYADSPGDDARRHTTTGSSIYPARATNQTTTTRHRTMTSTARTLIRTGMTTKTGDWEMTDRLRAHLHDGRGMTKAEREELMLDLEDTLEDELYIGGQQ